MSKTHIKIKTSLVLVVALLFSNIARAEITHVDNDALKSLLARGVTVIDIRTPDEWAATGIIEGSHPLMFFDRRNQFDLDVWMEQFRQLVPDTAGEFALICAGGVRSAAVSRVLDERLKYSGVSNVARGINEYISRGGAVVKWSP